jgi:phosphoglycerol transferase MdoB-like AlkP superfamily enzyme/glycerophosphoryl diester phosphodiesterase
MKKTGKDAACSILYVVFLVIVTAICFKHVTDFTGKRYILISAGLFLISVAIPFVLPYVKLTHSKVVQLFMLLIYPFLCFYFTERALETGFEISGAGKKILIGNYGLYALIIWFIFALTLSLGISLFTGGLLSIFFGISNYFTILYRQVPILAGDVATAGTAINVAGQYTYEMGISQFMAIMFVLATLSFALFYRAGESKEEKKKNKISIKTRILVAAMAIVIFAGAVRTIAFTDFLENQGISVHVWVPIKTYMQKGGLLTFARSIRNIVVDAPDGYSDEAVRSIIGGYSSDSASQDAVRPNVIAIMNEAFADLQDVGELETNIEVMPFYDSLTENTVKGWSYVSVFGGQTASSEYEFLSNDSMAFVPAGTTPYQLYIKRFMPTLTGNLVCDNYSRAIAMHPYKGNGYNRNNVYNILGFDEFITVDNFPADTDTIATHITDSADYARIIEEYEKSKAGSDEPFYLFNVTMQNHGPFSGEMENLPDEVKVLNDELNMDGVENYLNLIHESDKALKELVTYFENVDEPTVIVMFGDHQPGVGNKFYKKLAGGSKNTLEGEELMNLYHTKFLIWANYDIEEADYSGENGISINYLQSLMLDAAGMKKSGYNKFLLDVMKEVPILTANGYFGADGNFYHVDDETSPYYETLKKYNILVYNHLFDKKGRADEFYEYAGVDKGDGTPDNQEKTAYKDIKDVGDMKAALGAEGRIIHAAGFLQNSKGKNSKYTNSVEALNNSYALGNRFIEIDFKITTDNQLVCSHSWDTLYDEGKKLGEAVTLEKALSCRTRGGFTPMSFAQLVDFMKEHEDMYVITDFKGFTSCEGVGYIMDLCPDMKDRFIIQAYHEDEISQLEELGIKYIIYTLYRTEESERTYDALKEATTKHDLVAITLQDDMVTDDVVSTINSLDVLFFINTINEVDEMNDYISRGVDGFCTDVVDWDEIKKELKYEQ